MCTTLFGVNHLATVSLGILKVAVRERGRGRRGVKGNQKDGSRRERGTKENRRRREELPEWVIIANVMLDGVEEVPANHRHTLEVPQSEARSRCSDDQWLI